MNYKILIVAGEASGDLHGAGLVREIKTKLPNCDIFGIGGDKMQQQGVELFYHINQMSVIGFGDVIKRFPFFKKVHSQMIALMLEKQPHLLILIDYPGLNLRLAKIAKKLDISVFYYIAPQVWAWGKNRIPKMAKLVDKLAAIIPFEEQLFREAGIDAHFVGHPLLDVLSTKLSKTEFLQHHQLKENHKIIGLLPGSRIHEVNRLFPEMIRTATKIQQQRGNIYVLVGQAASVEQSIYMKYLENNTTIKLLKDSTYEIMKYSDLLIVASGTATLESALFETPLIVVYKVDPLSYFLGRLLIKVKNIGLVNVIAERQIVPELIQQNFNTIKLKPVAEKLLFDKQERQKVKLELKKIKNKLGQPGAAKRAAKLAVSMLK